MNVLFLLSLLLFLSGLGFGESPAKPPKAEQPGVKTPGVKIPMASLKEESRIRIPGLSGPLVPGRTPLAPQRTQGSLLRIDPKEYKPGAPIGGLAEPCSNPVSAFGSVWVPVCGSRGLARVDVAAGKVQATLPLQTTVDPVPIASSSDSIWVVTDARTTLLRIDPQSNEVVAEVRLPSGCSSLLFAEGALWATCPKENKVLRIEPKTNLVDKRIDVAPAPVALAGGAGSIWVLSRTDGRVSQIDPKTNKVSKTIELMVPNADGQIEFGEGSLWVSVPGFPITRINPSTCEVVQQFYGEGAGPIRAAMGFLWLSDVKTGQLLRFDPKRIAATLAE